MTHQWGGVFRRGGHPKKKCPPLTLRTSADKLICADVSSWHQGNLGQQESPMSNHFTGLSLGPPLGDQRLDLCDLYAFQSPADKNRTAIILNANPNADALHPDSIYRVNIDTDGDLLTYNAISYVFSKPPNRKQTFSVDLAKGAGSPSPSAVGKKTMRDAEVPHGPTANLVQACDYT